MFKSLVGAITLTIPLTATAENWNMANTAGGQGVIQQITGWNNDATVFGGQAEAWKKEYTPEAVKRAPDGTATAKGIQFCLKGEKDGAGLLSSGNNTSLSYEGYLGANPGDARVLPAYTNHEANLQSLNAQYKKDKQNAKCN